MRNNNEIPQLISSYLENHKLSYREFADQISDQLNIPDAISYQAIQYWVTGEFKPRPTLMALLYQQGHGSLKELALAVLQELKPDEYDAKIIAQPDSKIQPMN